MFGKNLFIRLTYVLYTVVVLHLLAMYFSWYWSIWWYDILVHFLGGFWVGGMAMWFYLRRKDLNFVPNNFKIFAISMLSVITIGVFWELFEFSLDTFIILRPNDIVDTLSDLGSDIAGGLTVLILFIRKKYNNNE